MVQSNETPVAYRKQERNFQQYIGRRRRSLSRRLAGAVCLVLTAVCLLAPAGALTPAYSNMSRAYLRCRYYLNLQALTLTGDARTDIVMVAMSQLGYREGNNAAGCNGEKAGNGNWTEYNYYNGAVDQLGNGTLTYAYPWCASFVTWCARMAGVPACTVPSSVNCAAWVAYFRAAGQFHSRGTGYVPQKGDLIFFRSAGATAVSNHVGIVRYVCGDEVYTVEGNRSDEVGMAVYNLQNGYIVGYASPVYAEKKEAAMDYLLHVYAPGDYIIAGYSVPVYGKAGGGKVTYTLRRGDLMHIFECRDGWGRTDYGWIPMGVTQPIRVEKEAKE